MTHNHANDNFNRIWEEAKRLASTPDYEAMVQEIYKQLTSEMGIIRAVEAGMIEEC